MMTADNLTSVRELDCRWTNGIQVRMLWCQTDGRVSVAVLDTRSGKSFRIEVPKGKHPLDVFDHPFAYAADSALIAASATAQSLSSGGEGTAANAERDREQFDR